MASLLSSRSLAPGFIGLAVLAVLAGCGGGGGGGISVTGAPPAMPAAPVSAAPTAATAVPSIAASGIAALTVGIPVPPATSALRRERTLVSNIAGLIILAYATSDTAHVNALVTVTADVSPASTACVTSGSIRTCSIALAVPPGTLDIVVNAYNAVPVAGAIPAGSLLVETGSASAQTILVNARTAINVVLAPTVPGSATIAVPTPGAIASAAAGGVVVVPSPAGAATVQTSSSPVPLPT